MAAQPSDDSKLSTVNVDSTEAFQAFVAEYGPYLQYNNLMKSELSTTLDIVNSLTSRTDEIGLLLAPLSEKTANRASVDVPELIAQARRLKVTFQSIDMMAELIEKLKLNVQEAQSRVDAAQDSSVPISMSKIFSVFSPKAQRASERSLGPLQVLDTKQEFSKMRSEIQAANQSSNTS